MPAQGTFHNFFECWLAEQQQFLDKLSSAAKEHENEENKRHLLGPLVDQVMKHYEQYYNAKNQCSQVDILGMFSPSWISSLENAFLWIGGWRPATAFHLLYSKSGLQLESQLEELFRGLVTNDLGNLSPEQFRRVDELHRLTIREEKEITEKMAKHQETVADASMVELSHSESVALTEVEESGRVESALRLKEEKLTEMLGRADDLRLRTLRGLVDVLTPIQAVHFLIAAAELHQRVHEWGKRKDSTN